MLFSHSKFIKQRKAIIIFLLFFIVFSIVPQKIAGYDVGGTIGGLLFGPTGGVVGSLGMSLASEKIKSKLSEIGSVFFNAFIYALGWFFLAIPLALSDTASIIFKFVIAGIAGGGISYTNSPAVRLGWPIVRDLANMFVVLGFVIIGIATILRVQDYQAKKLLPSLIIAALLINFSLLICGILIDGSNIAVIQFLKTNSLSDYWQNSGIATLADLFDQVWEDSIPAFLTKIVGIAFISALSALAFFLLTFLFLFRIFALWLLVILSPLAFVCYVFPFTRSVWKMWWSNFFNWCIIGIPASFFIYIATELQVKLIDETVTLDTTGLGNLARSFTGTFSFFLPGLFLIVGFLVSLQISAMGAGVITGMFSGKGIFAPGKFAGLAGKVTGKPLDKLAGGKFSEYGQKISGGVGRTMERIGLRKEGTTGMKESGRIAEEQKRYEAMFKSGNASDKARAKQAAQTGRGRNKAGAIAAAVATENINDVYKDSAGNVNTEAMNRGLGFTEKFGAGENLRKNAEKQNPLVAGSDEKKLDKNLKKINPALTLKTATAGQKEAARIQSVTDAVQKTAPGDAVKWDPNVITPEVFGAMRNNQLIEIGKRGKPELIEKVKKFKRARDPGTGAVLPVAMQSPEYQALQNHIVTNFGATSPEATNATKLLNEFETNNIFK